jgi:hypothetical protein
LAGFSKSLTILGLDVGDAVLRLVQLRQHQGGLVLDRAETVAMPGGLPAAALAELLRRTLREHAFKCRSVAICLPAGSGFLKSEDALDPAASPTTTDAQFIRASWTTTLAGRSVETVGFARRSDVSTVVDAAHRAGLHPLSVDLPQVAMAASLGLLNAPAATSPCAGLIIEPGRLFFTLSDSYTLSTSRYDRPNGTSALHTTSAQEMADSAAHLYRAAALREPAMAVREVRVIADADADLAQRIASTINQPTVLLRPGEAHGLQSHNWPDDLSTYSRAIGAALIGLGHTDRRMPFLQSLTRRTTPTRVWNPRRLAIIAAALLILALSPGVWVFLTSRWELAELQRQYEDAAPKLARQDAQRENWRIISPWLSQAQMGRRMAYADILHSLNDLFPHPDDAFVSQMTVDAADASKDVKIAVAGRARNSSVLFSYIAALNESDFFTKATIGAVTVDDTNPNYPNRFSLSMTLIKGR